MWLLVRLSLTCWTNHLPICSHIHSSSSSALFCVSRDISQSFEPLVSWYFWAMGVTGRIVEGKRKDQRIFAFVSLCFVGGVGSVSSNICGSPGALTPTLWYSLSLVSLKALHDSVFVGWINLHAGLCSSSFRGHNIFLLSLISRLPPHSLVGLSVFPLPCKLIPVFN